MIGANRPRPQSVSGIYDSWHNDPSHRARDMNRKKRNAYGEINARIEKDSEVQE